MPNYLKPELLLVGDAMGIVLGGTNFLNPIDSDDEHPWSPDKRYTTGTLED